MFGFGDTRLVREVSTGTFQLIGLLEASGIGQPPRFWRDPYVLGFLFGTATVLGHIASRGAIRGERGGAVVLKVLRELAGMRSDQTVASLMEFARGQDQEFLTASRIASQLVDYLYGNPISGLDLDLAKAEEAGRQLAIALEGKSNPATVRQYAYHNLVTEHWIDVVRERFGMPTPNEESDPQ